MTMTPTLLILLVACGSSSQTAVDGDTTTDGTTHDDSSTLPDGHRTVFVIPLENKSSSIIYNSAAAPYINNTLLAKYAHEARAFEQKRRVPDVADADFVAVERRNLE